MADNVISIIIQVEDKNAEQKMRGVADAAQDIQGRGGAALDAFREIGIGALRAVGEAAINMAAQGAQAIASFVQDSIGAAGDFEGGMNTFASAAGNMGQEELGEFKDLFLSLGKELPVSTTEVQDAATAMVKGGIDPAVVAGGALRDTLLFAAAAGMELEDSANLTAKMLGTFVDVTASAAEKTEFMAKSQELLVKAANASTLDVDKLGEAMLAAGGQAKAMELDYQDFVTTMGLISPGFASAAEAGTSFKNFLARLQPATAPATEAMRELGLVLEDGTNLFFDQQGNYIGGAAAAELLANATADLTAQEKAKYLQTIFGNDAMGAANALISAGASGYDAFAAAMGNANGIQATSAQTQQGMVFAMENFKGSVEALQIVLGTAFLPLLTSFMGQLTTGLGVVMTFVETFIKLAPAIGESTNPLQTFINVLSVAASAAIPGAGAQITNFASSIMPTLNAAMATGQQAFANFTSFIQMITPSVLGIVTSAVTIMTGLWQAHGVTITTVAQQAWQMVVGIIQIAVGVIQGIFAIFAAGLTGDYQTMGMQLTQANELIWTGIRTFIEGFLESVLALFGTNLAEFISIWQYNLDMVPVIAQAAIDGAIAAFESALGLAPGVGKGIIDGIIRGISEGAGKLAQAAAKAAESALKAAKSALGIQSPSSVFAEQVGKPITDGMVQGIQAGLSGVAAAGQMISQAALGGAIGQLAAIPATTSTSTTTVNIGSMPINAAREHNEEKVAEKVGKKLSDLVNGRRYTQ